MNIDEINIWCHTCGKKTSHRKDSSYRSPDDWTIQFLCNECNNSKTGTIQFEESRSYKRHSINDDRNTKYFPKETSNPK